MATCIPDDIIWVLNQLHDHDKEAFLIGGCVRDMLMKRDVHDFDITTNALPETTMDIFKKAGCIVIPTGIKHGTITVLVNHEPIEITTYRIEKAYLNHRAPSEVLFTKNLLEDLKRRDFTMNAIAYDPTNGYYDPFNGKKDIEQGIIRCVGDPKERLSEDALRILRAIRFSAVLDFSIEQSLKQAIQELAPTLSFISKERVRDEFNKILLSQHPNILQMLYDYQVLDEILPGYSKLYGHIQKTPWHIYDIFHHSDVALNHTLQYPLESKLAIVLHDIGKPEMETFGEDGVAHYKRHALVSEQKARTYLMDLRYDHKTIERVCTLILYHDYYVKPNRKILRRFLSKFDNDIEFAIQALYVQMADDYAKNMEKSQEKIDILIDSIALLKTMVQEKDFFHKKDLKVNGHDIMQLGLQNKQIGDMLEYLYQLVIDDPSLNEKETLLSYARQKMQN